jgi:hypothetical protein
MSLFNPSLSSPSTPARRAASLRTTLEWMARNAFTITERLGQRRAAPVLHRLGQRLTAEGHEAGPRLIQTAREWSAR